MEKNKPKKLLRVVFPQKTKLDKVLDYSVAKIFPSLTNYSRKITKWVGPQHYLRCRWKSKREQNGVSPPVTFWVGRQAIDASSNNFYIN